MYVLIYYKIQVYVYLYLIEIDLGLLSTSLGDQRESSLPLSINIHDI